MKRESATCSSPVLIVGAGPTGLVLALALLKNNISVRVIEKAENIPVGQRGAVIMPRSMELYNLLGVWPDIQHRAKVPPLMRVYKLPGGVEPVVTFAMDPHVDPTPSTPFMNFCMFGQDHVQEILVDHLVRHGCDVEFGTELCSFEQNLDTVTAHVLHRRGDEEINEHITCRWLMGTDGARGIVRKQLGLSFPGVTLPLSRHLIIGDIEVKGLDREYWHFWGDADTVFVTLRPTEDEGYFSIFSGGNIDIPKAVAEPDELLRVLRAGTGRDDIDLGVIRWISEYRQVLEWDNHAAS